MGTNKEIFDAELYGIDLALSLASQGGNQRIRGLSQSTANRLREISVVRIWIDSKSAIARLRHTIPGPGLWLACRIHANVRELRKYQVQAYVHWVPGHMEVEGNEIADRAAKAAALTGRKFTEEFITLAHIARTIIYRQRTENRQWFQAEHCLRHPDRRITYKLILKGKFHDITVFKAFKAFVNCYFQLKSQHVITKAWSYRITKQDHEMSGWCNWRISQTVKHLMFGCRRWNKEREEM